MKTKNTIPLILIAIFLLPFTITSQAQSSPATKSMYSTYVVENPNADADIKVVSDFVNATVSGDLDKARSLLAAGFIGHGPAPTDSSTAEGVIDGWKENYKRQSDRKVGFVNTTFKVLSGGQEGEWVSVWGTYNFTESGKNINLPFQYTAHVKGGKIDNDIIYYDRLYIMQTLGYTITPPASK